MKFCVLLSLYHKENPYYLNECLESVFNNTLCPSQVIIVFDGPIGASLEAVVDSFKDKLALDIIRLEKNVGLGNALNIGLSNCRYNIVIRMDTDDICQPNRFEQQIKFLKEHNDISLLGSAIEEFDETMRHSIGIRFSASEHNDIVSYARYRNSFNHMSVAFRKDAVQFVGGYKHHLFMEDYNLWLRMIASGYKTHNLTSTLVKVRVGYSMIKRRKGYEYFKSELKLAKLKYQLSIDTLPSIVFYLTIRVIPRFFPHDMLSYVYKKLRK